MLGSILILFSSDSSHLIEKFAKRQLDSRANTYKLRCLKRILDFAEKTLKANENSQRVVCPSEILLKGRGITAKKIRCCVAIKTRESIS